MVENNKNLDQKIVDFLHISTYKEIAESINNNIWICKDNNGDQFILKSIPILKSDGFNELNALKKLCHENIVKMLDYYQTNLSIYVSLEYIKGKDLFAYLDDNHFKPVEKNLIKRIFVQLIDAVYYCHSNGIIHRDIKLDNVLIDNNENVKLIDFGLCCFVESCCEKKKRACGTLNYVCPEILLGMEYISCLVDVWCLGMLFFGLQYGMPVFDENERETVNFIFEHPPVIFPEGGDYELDIVLAKMLKIKYQERIHLDKIFEEEYYKKSKAILSIT